MFRIQSSGRTDTGLLRTHNEDFFRVDDEHHIYIVADGMGGHNHGEVASRIAVESMSDFIVEHRGSDEEDDEAATAEHTCVDDELIEAITRESESAEAEGSEDTVSLYGTSLGKLHRHAHRLRDSIHVAHDRVLGAIRNDGALLGMGTTVVGVCLEGDIAAIAHVGDSRAYRVRNGHMELLTQDHTWVNEQVVAGYLSEEQAKSHPLKNVVTRALGGDSEVVVDVIETRIRPGDRYLLCSDGLTTMLSDLEIHECMLAEQSLEQTSRQLIEDANHRGGFDNVTVVLLAVDREGDGEVPAEGAEAAAVTETQPLPKR